MKERTKDEILSLLVAGVILDYVGISLILVIGILI